MSIFNALLRALFDALLAPFSGLHPLVGITLVSLVVAVGMLLVLKFTSNQEKLDAVKRRIHASLFEIRLFNDDVRAILRAQWDILRHNASYLGLWIVPLLWMIVPLVLILAQLQFHYGYRGLEPGATTLLEVQLKPGEVGYERPELTLEAPEGLRVEAGPVWVPSLGELTWRLAAGAPGDYQLRFTAGGETYTKSVRVSDQVVRRSPLRVSPGFFDQLLFPAEDPLPAAAPIESIALDYPPADGGIGWEHEIAWMVVFFVLSLIFAFLLRRPLNVTF